MRLIHLRVPAELLEAVTGVLEDRDISYVRTDEQSTDDDGALFQFPLPPEAVEEVFQELEDAGLDTEDYAVIARAETAGHQQSVAAQRHEDRISHEELRSRAVGLNPGIVTYYLMTVLSAVVATAGLLLNSPAIVVGSMVIAPQVGSALTASVGTTLNDRNLVTTGLRDQAFGLLVAIAGAAAFGLVVRYSGLVPVVLRVSTVQQISQRISPGFLSMAVGVSAGAAGAVGLATALPVSLVGVMIAAALIPAAAAVGVGIAWGIPAVALGAGILLLVNVAAVNLVAVVVLWGLGFRPDTWTDGWPDMSTLRAHAPTVLAIVVLTAAFVGATGVTAEQMEVEGEVNGAVTGVLADSQYRHLQLLSVSTQFGGISIYRLDREVTVELSRPDGARYPALAPRLDRRIERAIGERAAVTVRYDDRRTTQLGDPVEPSPVNTSAFSLSLVCNTNIHPHAVEVVHMADTPDDFPEMDEGEVEALHAIELGQEWVRRAHGNLIEFHHATGHAMDHLHDAETELRAAGHDALADELRDDLLPRGAVEDRWTYDLLETFEANLLADVVDYEERAREDLADGESHVAERRQQREWRQRADGK